MVLTQNKKCQAYESFNKETNQCEKVCNEKEFYSEKYSSCIACDEGEVFNSQSDQCIKNDKCPPDTIPRGNICEIYVLKKQYQNLAFQAIFKVKMEKDVLKYQNLVLQEQYKKEMNVLKYQNQIQNPSL